MSNRLSRNAAAVQPAEARPVGLKLGQRRQHLRLRSRRHLPSSLSSSAADRGNGESAVNASAQQTRADQSADDRHRPARAGRGLQRELIARPSGAAAAAACCVQRFADFAASNSARHPADQQPAARAIEREPAQVALAEFEIEPADFGFDDFIRRRGAELFLQREQLRRFPRIALRGDVSAGRACSRADEQAERGGNPGRSRPTKRQTAVASAAALGNRAAAGQEFCASRRLVGV